MDQTIITQTLVSIQGEGLGIGRPILLIRTHGCNLNCKWCDTKWTNEKTECKPFSTRNTKTPFIINKQNIQIFVSYIKQTFLLKYPGIKTVLFTGGETFLRTDFMSSFMSLTNKMFDRYEIETNGTLLSQEMTFIQKHKNEIQLNISPKIEYREKYDEKFFKMIFLINSYKNGSFLKFVYYPEAENKIVGFMDCVECDIPIMVTPMTPNYNKTFMKKYKESCLKTVDFVLRQKNVLYSPREHVFLFGENREEYDSLNREITY